jgi:hypothetical protein
VDEVIGTCKINEKNEKRDEEIEKPRPWFSSAAAL